MKIVERRIREVVNIDGMRFDFILGRQTHCLLSEEYRDKCRKLYMHFVGVEKAFYRVPRKVMEWAMRKKYLPEIIVEPPSWFYDKS